MNREDSIRILFSFSVHPVECLKALLKKTKSNTDFVFMRNKSLKMCQKLANGSIKKLFDLDWGAARGISYPSFGDN